MELMNQITWNNLSIAEASGCQAERGGTEPPESTEMRFIICTWFGEFCSCCSLTALPGAAWVLLNWICKELISSLYLRRGSYSILHSEINNFVSSSRYLFKKLISQASY